MKVFIGIWFCCHGSIPTVLNFWIYRDQLFIRPIEKTVVLERLGINETIWRVLGIVSGNDYSDNVYGYVANRNLEILREQWSDNMTALNLIARYAQFVATRWNCVLYPLHSKISKPYSVYRAYSSRRNK